MDCFMHTITKNGPSWLLSVSASVVAPSAAPSSRVNSHVARITSFRAGALAVVILEYA